jgi:serine/threonine protein kinase/tetratricopeptide (TPR) repeat protein
MADISSQPSSFASPPTPAPRRSSEHPEADSLAVLLAEKMARRWKQGERPLAEEFLNAHPELWDNPEAAADLIYEEMCLRQKYGEEIPSDELLRRFPQWRHQLEVLLHCHQLLEPARAAQFPAPGSSLGDFDLVAELGRGGQGRVFLATQRSLADRPIVLKCTPLTGQEHLSLARLQHTHIVPLYSVQDNAASHLRVLCMPYFGGTSLARLLRALRDVPLVRRRGQDLLDALDQAGANAGVTFPRAGPARQWLAQASYAQAICWIGACLADALQYAHERGLVHLDLKPGNVLLAADGQPMLLDFHLARAPVAAGAPVPEWIGGTPTYMSPEQRAALAAVHSGTPLREPLDGRSDIYSLGLLLYESLGGSLPPAAERGVALSRLNPQVSAGLADIIGRCLASSPADRYASAADLVADLRRHLANEPLQGVSNRSILERLRKWRRRKPHGVAILGMVLVVLIAAVTTGIQALSNIQQQSAAAQAALADGKKHLQDRRYSEAVGALQRGLSLAEGLPGGGKLHEELTGALREAEQARLAAELHAFLERVRLLYGLESLPAEQLRPLAARCRAFWDKRQLIWQRLGPDVESEAARSVRTDLLDLAILGSDLRVRAARSEDVAAAREEALRVLAEAERQFGGSPLLEYERRRYAEALERKDVAEAAARKLAKRPPQSAWEYFAMGRALLRAGDVAEAARFLEEAVERQPNDLWAFFYQGVCAYRRQRYGEAVTAFTACISQSPDTALFRYNRALAYSASGDNDRALRDYDQALRLDPGLAQAALNRAVLHYHGKRFTEAVADLERAAKNGADLAAVEYNRALVLVGQDDKSAARRSLRKVLERQPEHAEARELLRRLDKP